MVNDGTANSEIARKAVQAVLSTPQALPQSVTREGRTPFFSLRIEDEFEDPEAMPSPEWMSSPKRTH
ncbi:MAG: hypothetical protein WCV62_00310 [Candidatus Peribacteraceae bacterium]